MSQKVEKFGGTFSHSDLDNLKKLFISDIEKTIALYKDYFYTDMTLDAVAKKHGLKTRESARIRINRFTGKANQLLHKNDQATN